MATPKKMEDTSNASVSLGSDEVYTLLCVPCHRDKTTLPAYGYCVICQEHLCRTCYKHHQKSTPSRHHRLQDEHDMPSTQQLIDVDVIDHMTCLSEICVKTSEDRRMCWISGMTVLPPDRLVLTDWLNNSIKLVDINSRSLTSHMLLGTGGEYAPWNITSITNTQVAVTLPYGQRIQLMSVLYSLSKTSIIQTNGACYGICCYQNQLLVTYRNPGKLEILDIEGRVLTRVQTDATGADVFDEPRFVQADINSIYVSNNGQKEVIVLNWQGEITGKIGKKNGHGEMFYPRGVALLADGSLLVCDCEKNTMWHVSSDRTRTRRVLHDVQGCEAVCVDAGQQKLFTSRASGFEYALREFNNVNTILVYSFNI